jgi:site-specific recombinase XerD
MDVTALVDSFEISLKAARRSPQTLKIYLTSVRQYLKWCADNAHEPTITRSQVSAWIAALLDDGAQPATAAARLAGVRQFSKWLAAEGETDSDPLKGLTAPKGDQPITPVLTDDQLRALIKACHGKALRDRRDEAMVRLMAETGMRAMELLSLEVDDIDLARGLAVIRRGKGGKARVVPFGPQTSQAIDRYIRIRRTHPAAADKHLWLGARTRGGLGPHGLRVTLNERAAAAGIAKFHPHVLRHTAASRWLSAGGTEGGLMAVAGWSSREMLDRYARATKAERAAAEARGLNLGDL